MPISISNKTPILEGRKAIDAYRQAHNKLHSKPWNKSIPKEHTPLIEQMLTTLKEQGFNSIDKFFKANYALNKETFEESYQWEGECDGCPNRKIGCTPECFADLKEYSKKYHCDVIPKSKIGFFDDMRYYLELYGIKPNKPIIPNCKLLLKVVKEPDIDWRWH